MRSFIRLQRDLRTQLTVGGTAIQTISSQVLAINLDQSTNNDVYGSSTFSEPFVGNRGSTEETPFTPFF